MDDEKRAMFNIESRLNENTRLLKDISTILRDILHVLKMDKKLTETKNN